MRSIKLLLITLSIYTAASGVFAEFAPTAKKEIAHLFSHLENSGCSFQRNGTWHTAKEAVSHLNQKYQYLLQKNLLSSTEDFITRAASKSSMSGKTYLVKCGDVTTPSAEWFLQELKRFRK